jgi:hypothetical protein
VGDYAGWVVRQGLVGTVPGTTSARRAAPPVLIHGCASGVWPAELHASSASRCGSALGGIGSGRFLPRALHALAGALYDGPTRHLARWLDATGPVVTLSTACASGASSIGLGVDLLHAGAATVVVAGGVDILCRFVMSGFNRLRSLTRDKCGVR